MRWEALFADLEAQAQAQQVLERAAEVDERSRGELATLGMLERLRPAVGAALVVRVVGHPPISGRLVRAAPQWLLLDEGAGREVIVAVAAICGLRGLGRYAAAPGSAGVVESRLGLRHALRGLARDRSALRLLLRDGSVGDATIDRVGADFVETAVHAPGELRRRAEVRHTELVPLSAIVAVRRWA